ncbi:MAG: 50S ribosomal protein L15 [Candidatus Cryptobacteroides sp.]
MNLHNLKPAKGSTHNSKRLGRGQGSGKGGTSTRGTKGAQARAGYEHKVGFEGGQMPIQRRLPKFGFNNPTRKEYKALNLDSIQALSEKLGTTVITLEAIKEAGLAGRRDLVKILGNGELTAKLEITADAFSQSALSKIEAVGGKATKTEK